MPMDPAPANAVRVPEFNAACTYSHSLKDDPIVFPGLPGASHMHSFIGNRSTDANTTADTLLANAGTELRAGPGPLGVLDPDAVRARPAGRAARRDRLLRLAPAPTRPRRCRSRRASG